MGCGGWPQLSDGGSEGKHLFVAVRCGEGHAQSRRADGRFPRQSRENASVFNEDTARYAVNTWGAIPLDFLNLTADAPSSDGVHFLSDVNLDKAFVLLRALELLANRGSSFNV